MEVTRDNFNQIYPEFKKKLQTASFISFDEEMTGIMSEDYTKRQKRSDDCDVRYARMVPVATRYGIVQLGLCMFHEKEEEEGRKVYEVTPYTFYLFPDNGPDISLSTSSIKFLRNNNMNFDKWISRGINYVTERDEIWLRAKHLEVVDPTDKEAAAATAAALADAAVAAAAAAASPTSAVPTAAAAPAAATDAAAPAAPTDSTPAKENPIVLTRQWDVDYFARNVANLDKFIADPAVKEFHFEKSNGFMRKVIYQHMEANHPTLTVTKGTDERLRVLKFSEAEKKNHQKNLMQEGKKKFDEAMGFRKVWVDLVAAKRPLVGHNCLFDLMFMMRHLNAPLEDNLTEFKAKLNGYFPTVFDTKFIATAGVLSPEHDAVIREFGDSSLGELYKKLVRASQPEPTAPATTETAGEAGAEGGSSMIAAAAATALSTAAPAPVAAAGGGEEVALVSTSAAAAATATSSCTAMEVVSNSPSTAAPLDAVVVAKPRPVDFRFAPGFDAYASGDGQFHDAGYDAFCTGAVFCYELLMLPASDASSSSSSSSSASTSAVVPSPLDVMTEIAGNKVFMMQSLYHMDLTPGRPNGWIKVKGAIVHLSNFPAETKPLGIIDVFTAAGYEMKALDLVWIDGTATFVVVNGEEGESPEAAAEAIVAKLTMPEGWRVQTFEQFKADGAPKPMEVVVVPGIEGAAATAAVAVSKAAEAVAVPIATEAEDTKEGPQAKKARVE